MRPLMVIIAAISVLATTRVMAQCAIQQFPDNASGSIALMVGSGGVTAADLNNAKAYWLQCSQYGTGFPQLSVNGFGTITVTVNRGGDWSPFPACAVMEPTLGPGGEIDRATVTVYDRVLLNGIVFDCIANGMRAETIAHEVGHVLGLGHSGCSGRIMSPAFQSVRSVRSDECTRVAAQWETPPEQHESQCQMSCWTACQNGTCPPWTPYTDGTCCSPVIIDLDDDGFSLTDVARGVPFDITGDGVPERMSWTERGGGDAFLVLDRNHNGRIDGGQELFGNVTPLHSGAAAPNGYVALAEFDDTSAGGDGDGLITCADSVWQFLRMWTDANHDGVSQQEEIVAMEVAGVYAIDLDYKRLNRTDKHGNEFRFKARALVRDKHGKVGHSTTYDVFFVVW